MALCGLCTRRRTPQDSGLSTNPQQLPLSRLSPGVSDLYQYVPLNEEANEIRILTLLPGAFSSEIRVCLDITPFTEDYIPEFEAVSYAWGTIKNLVNVFIGRSSRKTIAVTQNLAEALPYFRYEDKPRVLWIDAICVDQGNPEERGHQVRRMADIYSKATKVLVWLGPESDNSILAINCLDYISSKVKVDWTTSSMTATTDEIHWADSDILPNLNDAKLLAITHLLHRPWFERLWIRQEVHLASADVEIVCGKQKILWEAIRTAVMCLYFKRRPWFSQVQEYATGMRMVRNLCYGSKNTGIVNLIHETKSCNCSDPRDKIYALLSLLPRAQGIGIKPDYTINVHEAYQQATLSLIKSSQRLEVLCTVEMHEHLEGVPSWVPDWTVARPCKVLALSSASSDIDHRLAVNNDGNILKVEGVIVEVIQKVLPFDLTRYLGGQAHEMKKLAAWAGIQAESYQSDELQALARTLTTNNFAERYYPQMDWLPTAALTEKELYRVLEPGIFPKPKAFGEESYKSRPMIRAMCSGRSFYMTENRVPGLGPLAAKTGDHVMVLLGCNAPIILRPTINGGYKVVGEAYCDDFMDGEALLGPLPDFFKPVFRYDSKNVLHCSYLNQKTGVFQAEDPRLGTVPSEWSATSHENEEFKQLFLNDETGEKTWGDPRLTSEALRKRGVPLQVFDLV